MSERHTGRLFLTMMVVGPMIGLATMTIYDVLVLALRGDKFSILNILVDLPQMLLWSYVVGLIPATICAGLSSVVATFVPSRVARVFLAPALGALVSGVFAALITGFGRLSAQLALDLG